MSPADLVVSPMGVRFAGRRFPCVLGRGGKTDTKREGDMATPRGAHRILGMLYRADRMAAPAAWAEPILPRDLWCDAPNHPAYNQPVRAPFSASHEQMRRADPLYDLVLITDWNFPRARPGAGSAIFVHRWRRPVYPTAGCVGLRPDHLLWIAARLKPGAGLLVL